MKSLIAILLFCLSISSLSQTTLTVTNLNDSGPGSLRQQVFNSNSGDRIVFDASLLNNGSDTLFLNFPIIVDNGLSITGLIRGGDTLFISGHDSTQIFYMDFSNIPGQEVYLDSLAVIDAKKYAQDGLVQNQNGGVAFVKNLDILSISNSCFKNCKVQGDGNGGAFFVVNTSLSIFSSVFTLNHTDSLTTWYGGRSGALECRNGDLILDQVKFIDNYSSNRGGAMYLTNTEFVMTNCLFVGNSAGFMNPSITTSEGGAFRCYGAESSSVTSCVFLENRAEGVGGALSATATIGLYSTLQIFDSFFSRNESIAGGGAICSDGMNLVSVTESSFIGNKSLSSNPQYGGAGTIHCYYGGVLDLNYCTFVQNQSNFHPSLVMSFDGLHAANSTFCDNVSPQNVADIDVSTSTLPVLLSSSIFSRQIGLNIISPDPNINSLGNNIFSNSPSFAIASDQTNIDSTTLALEPLAMNGGLTPTMLPGPTSVALNMGNPTDFSDAQNGPIYGRRDIGAAERPVISYDTTSACTPVSWWGNTYGTAGTYLDTAYNANSIDSVGVLVLELQDTSVFDLDGTLYASEQDTNTTYQWVDCDNNYAVIVGATSRGFLPPANGNYAVILTNQNCVDTSSCISYNRFSISERSSTEDWLTFYPNPTSGVIHYSFTGNAPMQVEVLDLSGRNVTTFELDGETTLQLPSLANGTYLLRWMGSQGEVQVDRIVINN